MKGIILASTYRYLLMKYMILLESLFPYGKSDIGFT